MFCFGFLYGSDMGAPHWLEQQGMTLLIQQVAWLMLMQA